MKNLECPHCGQPLTDEELRALWGRRNALKTSPAKAEASRENGRKGGEANRAKWAKIREEKNG